MNKKIYLNKIQKRCNYDESLKYLTNIEYSYNILCVH